MWFYRLLISVLAPVLAVTLALPALRGREPWAVWLERIGLAGVVRGKGPGIWVHAASNGELNSALPVLQALTQARPDLEIFVTTNSLTGRALAREHGFAAQCAPLDLRWAAGRILRRRRVALFIVLESEFWPNRFAASAARNIPVVILGARMTEKTAQGWARFGGLARGMMRAVTWATPQDAGSAKRLIDLGVLSDRVGPVQDLKAHYTRPAPNPLQGWHRSNTWLAASTHEGEENIVLAAHQLARQQRPDLRLILAPRHVTRGDEVAALIDASSLSFARRSHHDEPDQNVLLADTMGEMAMWYDTALVCFVGGSLTDRGGHTPHEPVAHGCTVLHGPHDRNFADTYGALDQAGGAIRVQDADSLARAVLTALDPETSSALQKAAATALDRKSELAPLINRITSLLPRP